MKKSESRFFLNWQLSKDEAFALHQATSDKERTQLLEKWVARTPSILTNAQVDDS